MPSTTSPFKTPIRISNKLCDFLHVPEGTLISRTEVTSRICRYAKEKGLMEEEGQTITIDATLRELLNYTEDRDLDLLHLQYYLKPHYSFVATRKA